MLDSLKDFLKLESAGGVLLVAAAALAMLVANSPLARFYSLLIEMPVEVRVGPLQIAKPLLLWINDGLMAVFFFLVGLEFKRELLVGHLSDIRKVALPLAGAIGGMAVPALIYALLNWQDPNALKGWAIPAATDIAFSLGVLTLLGDRVPASLKVFLVSLAVFDDVGAVLIIAFFYTSKLSPAALLVALGCVPVLILLNRRAVMEITPYLLVGIVMWIALLKSGVHATLAGVLLAFFIPLEHPREPGRSLLRQMEHDLHTTVAFVILPLFAFTNSGISLSGGSLDKLLHPVPLGIAAGLFLGKQLGVTAFCWLGVKLGLARLPEDIGWKALYGTAVLCGLGFTMSLFIASLAFDETGVLFDDRLGIMTGSLLSGLTGYLLLRRALRAPGGRSD